MQKIHFAKWLALSAVLFPSLVPAAPDSSTLLTSQTHSFDPKLSLASLRVEGTRLLNARGQPVLLRGVNIASLEWNNQGDHMQEAMDHAIRVWRASLIRMPLAQDRWFGKAARQDDGGLAYRRLVDSLVDACAAAGVYLDLDLHWSNRGQWSSEGGKLAQHLMPDELSVLFWQDVAARYKDHPFVIFGLYNEPHDVSWDIWRDGGTVAEKPARNTTNQPPVSYQAVGMQELYGTVRAAGARNVVTASGLDWGYDLHGLLEGHALRGTNIVYETHPYPNKKDWDRNFGQVSEKYAVFIGEWGGRAKDLEYGQRLMDCARQRGLPWTAWCFHPSAGPTLIKNWAFEPTDFGSFVKGALTGRSGGSPP
jgi:hypothetical protein